MTKRILAAFLAVMMVVGILPASVFAAEEDDACAVLGQYTDHSKAHCAKAGVEYKMVPNSTVAPECGQDGYTLYQCACGTYFADDIVDMDDHKTESGEPKAERVEPTCYQTGKVAVYVCDVCHKDYFKPEDLEPENVDENGIIAKTAHTFDQIDYPGNDCTKAERVCENEGCTAKDEEYTSFEAHDWNYNDPNAIVVAPTAHAEGKAVFKCSREGCAQTKTVKVLKLDHATTMVLHEAFVADCDTKGNIEYYTCKDAACAGLFFLKVDNSFVETPWSDIELDFAHEWNEDPTIVEPTCTEWGFSYYGCPRCGAKKDFTEVKPLGHTPYACDEHEEFDDECDVCADAALSEDKDYTAPNCTTDGEYTWNCGREDCDEDLKIVDPKTGHNEKTVNVPGTHAYGCSYTIVYCVNENCPLRSVDTKTVLVGEQNVELDVTVEVREDGNVYDLPAGTLIHLIEVKNVKAVTSDLKHFFVEDKEVQAPTCTEDGKAFWYCSGKNGCNTYFDQVLEALGHDYSDVENDIPATCTTNAYKVCEECGHEEEQEGTKGHDWADEKSTTTLPTCLGGKGYDIYECEAENCGAVDKRNEKSFEANKTYVGRPDLNMTAKKEFEAEHPNFDGEYVKYRDGDCLNNGYWKATCDDCDKTYLVLIDNTGKGHKAPEGTTYYENATCTNAQGYVDYVCTLCNNTIENTNEPLGHDMTEYEANDPTCTEDGNHQYWTCSRCKENVAEEGEEPEWIYTIYKDEDGETTYADDAHIIPALGHLDSTTTVTRTCTTPGFVHHICERCGGEEYVDGYIAPLTHTKGDKEYLAPSCTEDGYENFKCGRSDCDGYYSEKVLYATGHKNEAGQTITDICTDTVTDRVCVNENCPIAANEDGKKIVDKSHKIETETAFAGCEHYGYVMTTCANGCGEKDEITSLVEPSGHLAPWGGRFKEGDALIVDEDVVEYYGLEFLNTDPEEYDGSITAYTAPTYEALGSISFECCAHCGDELTLDVIRTGVDFTMDIDNAAVSGSNDIVDEDGEIVDFIPVDSDVIAVDIYMNAYETDVWGFNFDVDYSASSLNFLGYVYHAGDVFGNSKVNNKLRDLEIYEFDEFGWDENGNNINDLFVVAEDYYGVIKISAYTENGMDGKINDAEITGTMKVITLYFQVEAMFEYTEFGVENADFDYDFFIDMAYYNYPTVTNSEGEVDASAEWVYGDIAQMMDTNPIYDEFYGEYVYTFNITDLMNCAKILTGESEFDYLAAADANKDGVITITDLSLMSDLLQGADEATIYEALNWTAPDGFVAA